MSAMSGILSWMLVATFSYPWTLALEDAGCLSSNNCSDANEASEDDEVNALKASLLQRTKGAARSLGEGMSESGLLARKEDILVELAKIDQQLEASDEDEDSLQEEEEEEEEVEDEDAQDEELEAEHRASASDANAFQGTPGEIQFAKKFSNATELAARHQRLDQGLEEKLYHQTDMHACRLIFAGGDTKGDHFKPGRYGLAGPGIYFAVKAFHTQWKAQKFGCMIEAVVKTGNMKQLDFKGDKTLNGEKALEKGWDSTWIPRGIKPHLTPEVVIYFNDQIVKMTHYPCDKKGRRTGQYLSPKIEYTRKCAGAAAFPCVYKGGCNAPREPEEPCQCSSTCKKSGDCCVDYDAVCDKLKGAGCKGSKSHSSSSRRRYRRWHR